MHVPGIEKWLTIVNTSMSIEYRQNDGTGLETVCVHYSYCISVFVWDMQQSAGTLSVLAGNLLLLLFEWIA